jgi:tetratricopeptide (TPR) repeat protein
VAKANAAMNVEGDLELAAREFVEALALDPANGEARRGLERVRDVKAAPFRAAIRSRLANANRLFEEVGDVDGALAEVDVVLKLEPGNPDALSLRDRLLRIKAIQMRKRLSEGQRWD